MVPVVVEVSWLRLDGTELSLGIEVAHLDNTTNYNEISSSTPDPKDPL